jgi:DNA-binding HxlR family transcriptional regulator
MATNTTPLSRAIPDKTDLEMMLLISQGGGQNWYLAQTFEYSKARISQRIQKLQDWGLVRYTDKSTSQSKDKRDYELTEQGQEIIQSISVHFQFHMLTIKRNIA